MKSEKCGLCDGNGNTWLVTYEGEKVVLNFFGEGKHLENGRTLNFNIFSLLYSEYMRKRLLNRDPKSQDVLSAARDEAKKKGSEFREVVQYYDQHKDVNKLRDKDDGILSHDELVRRLENKVLIAAIFDMGKLYADSDKDTDLYSKCRQDLITCNRCETGKNKLANKKSVNAF